MTIVLALAGLGIIFLLAGGAESHRGLGWAGLISLCGSVWALVVVVLWSWVT